MPRRSTAVTIGLVRELFKKHPWTLAGLTVAAVALRLLFLLRWPWVDGDALIYSEIARNLIHDHIYGLARASGIFPTLIRLPGYPLFLAACFKLFGDDNFRAVMLVQLVFDLGTCFLVAETARRLVSERAATIAFGLACLCPFTANYVGTGLTETMEIFFTALALLLAAIALERDSLGYWAWCGLAVGGAIQLRPDGGLLLISLLALLVWNWWKQREARRRVLVSAAVLTLVALAPLIPWTIRNWRTFQQFQPLVTINASDPDEFVPRGWNRWVNTWIADYSFTEDLTFNVSGTAIDPYALPRWAYDSPQEFQRVAALFAVYNKTLTLTPDLDRQFGELAQERSREHWLRTYIGLPLVRLVGVWFRPRTEMMPLDIHWWDFGIDAREAAISIALGIFNFLLLYTALRGALSREARFLGLLVIYPVLRSLLLLKMAAVEDRYTLECFPMIFVLAAAWSEHGRRIWEEIRLADRR